MNDIRVIFLVNGGFTIVDSNLFDELNRWRWTKDSNNSVKRWTKVDGKNKSIYLHRIVNKTPVGLDTDHRNLNRLDNRRTNLRSVTESQNNCNMAKQRATTSASRFKGVTWAKSVDKWMSRIRFRGKRFYLGCFLSEMDAAQAYNKEAQKLHGEFARLNQIPPATEQLTSKSRG